jgi:hypothetical protein
VSVGLLTRPTGPITQGARIENHTHVADALVAVAAEVRENVQLRRAAG